MKFKYYLGLSTNCMYNFFYIQRLQIKYTNKQSYIQKDELYFGGNNFLLFNNVLLVVELLERMEKYENRSKKIQIPSRSKTPFLTQSCYNN